jgi:F0F1-type ATP synthase assembly protein I
MLIDPKYMRYYAALSGAVLTKVALVVGGFFLGSWLDRRYGTYPLFMFSLVVIAAGLGIWYVIYVATKVRA